MRARKLGTASFLFGLGVVVASCATPSSGSGDDPSSFDVQSIFDARDPAAHELAEDLAYQYLDANEDIVLYGVDDVSTRAVFLDDLGQAHTRLVQTLDGVPVFGAEAIVHIGPDGGFRFVTDGLLHDLRVDTTPVLADTDAVELAVAATGGWALVTGLPQVDLQILRHDGIDYLAWRVQIRQFEAGSDPAMPVVFVDAQFGDVVWQYDNLEDVSLSDADKRVYDMGHGTSYTNRPISDSSDPIANETWLHTGLTLAYYQSAHGRDSFDGAGGRVDSYVHYSTGYVNAFWDGSVLTFGDGDNVESGPLTTLDIVAHEFSHGVTEHSANLTYADESGALNEATSDIFAAAVEAQQPGATFDDIWWVGEDTWLAASALRYMNDPAQAGDYDYYPTRYTGSSDNGGVHWNSGIANLAFQLLAAGGSHPRGKTTTVVTGIGVQNAAAVWYRALTVYMVPSTDFRGARAATVAAATDLNPAWVVSVQQAWDAVGVSAPPNYAVIDQKPNLSGASGSQKQFGPYNTSGCTAIKFQISGGTGDSDLYARFGGAPSRTLWDCRPYTTGSAETCEFNPAQSGSYYAMVDGYTAFSGVTLTVSAACGAPPPVEICTDGIDNDGDSAIDCADTDCAAAPSCVTPPPPEVCTDGIDNDLDGKIDCADSDCASAPSCAPPPWVELSNTNFETSFGVYTDGGGDARRASGSFSHQGTWSGEIRDNSGAASSFYSTNGINLVGRTALKIDFWYQARGMDNGDDFFVEVWNGSAWVVVGTFVRGPSINNNVFYNPVLTVTPAQVAFTAGAKVRFRCDATNDNDLVYIDQVVISAR